MLFKDYFWPKHPRQISDESKLAFEKDIADKGLLSIELNDEHRQKVDVWTRHSDNQARAKNREWFGRHGKKFAIRWGVLSTSLWISGFLVSGNLWLEVPLVLSAFGTGVIGMGFFYAFRTMNAKHKT